MNSFLRRALLVIAAASVCLIAISLFRLTTRSASATADPFVGISAAETAPVVPADAAALQQMRDPDGNVFGGANLGAARQLPSTIAGHAVYVMPSSYGGFCLFIDQLPSACASTLTDADPALVVTFDPDGAGGSSSTVFGIARDGVGSITLGAGGTSVEVPVHGNVFELSGTPSSPIPQNITNVTASFDDGSSVALK